LGFAEALDSFKEKKNECKKTFFCKFDQSLLSPYLSSPLLFKTKKGGNDVLFGVFMVAS
jgi:hypothetical protein